MTKIQTNALSIYLIKNEYRPPESILKDCKKLNKEHIDKVGDLYYKDSHDFKPSWLEKFFNNSIDETKIFNSTSMAVLLIHLENRIFVVPFGYGHTLLNHGTYEERFGLKIALDVIGLENIRTIEKTNMSITPKITKEQTIKEGSFTDFGIDVEQDLIRSVRGKSEDQRFGKTVSGGDMLRVSTKIDISNIKSFLKICLEKYGKEKYKERFPWIDNISEVRNLKDIESLDQKLVEEIKNEDPGKIWMAVPEIIEWEKVSEFKFKKHSFGNDIAILPYLGFLSEEEKQSISPETLKKHKIRSIDASSEVEKYNWSVYSCLYCEVTNIEGKTHVLSNGKWYQIENSFLQTVSKSFESLKKQSNEIDLPICNQKEREDDYSRRIAEERPNNMCNMDKKMIRHGGVNQQIEFCDSFTKDKKIIHIKKYGASSVLSHLFSQGLVSGELFSQDPDFRKKVNDRLPDDYKIENVKEKPNPSDYEIIFAIISKSKKDIDIPFFSKVNIKNVSKRLKSLGYSVSLIKISTKEE